MPASPRPAVLNGDLVDVPRVQAVTGRPCCMLCAVCHVLCTHARHRGIRHSLSQLSPAPPPLWGIQPLLKHFCHRVSRELRCATLGSPALAEQPHSPWACLALTMVPLPARRQPRVPGVAVAEHGVEG